MSATKERIPSRSEGPGGVLSLTAAAHVAENSRQGFTTEKINSHPGWSEVNFKSLSGIEVSLRRNGIRSRCQSLNRYAYALNNPTTLTDPLGLFAPGPCIDPNNPNCHDPFLDEFFVQAIFGYGGGYSSFHSSGGGGGRRPPARPVITNPSQTGPQQSLIGSRLNQLLSALACDPECTTFLAQKGLDPVQTLTDLINNNLYGHADISMSGNPYSTGAVSGGVAGQAITVNNQGAFFSGTAPGGLTLSVGPSHIPGGTPAAQGFILLHELGHNTGVLRPDAGIPKAGRQNDQDIQAHCQKTIDSFK